MPVKGQNKQTSKIMFSPDVCEKLKVFDRYTALDRKELVVIRTLSVVISKN